MAITLTRDDFDVQGSGAGFYDAGIGGLGFDRTTPGAATQIAITPFIASLATQGYDHGDIHSIIGRLPPSNFSSGSDSYGIACMLDTEDFGMSGSGYTLEYHPVNGNVVLGKMSGSGLASRSTLVSIFLPAGQDRPMQLLWLLDPYDAKWVFLRAIVSNDEVITYQDFFTPIASTTTEGYFINNVSGNYMTAACIFGELYAET